MLLLMSISEKTAQTEPMAIRLYNGLTHVFLVQPGFQTACGSSPALM